MNTLVSTITTHKANIDAAIATLTSKAPKGLNPTAGPKEFNKDFNKGWNKVGKR